MMVVLRVSIGVAALVAMTASAQNARDVARANLAVRTAAPAATPSVQPLPPAPADPAIASLIAQWKALQQTDALPFDSYAGFLMAHRGWPGEAAMKRVETCGHDDFPHWQVGGTVPRRYFLLSRERAKSVSH